MNPIYSQMVGGGNIAAPVGNITPPAQHTFQDPRARNAAAILEARKTGGGAAGGGVNDRVMQMMQQTQARPLSSSSIGTSSGYSYSGNPQFETMGGVTGNMDQALNYLRNAMGYTPKDVSSSIAIKRRNDEMLPYAFQMMQQMRYNESQNQAQKQWEDQMKMWREQQDRDAWEKSFYRYGRGGGGGGGFNAGLSEFLADTDYNKFKGSNVFDKQIKYDNSGGQRNDVWNSPEQQRKRYTGPRAQTIAGPSGNYVM